MDDYPLLEPVPFDCPVKGGAKKRYILSTFPTVAGREIIAKYPLSGMPKLGDYAVNEETMLKLMHYVAVPVEGREAMRLSTRELIDNHVPNWEVLARIEIAMLKNNCSFFADGRASSFLTGIAQQLLPLITKTLTGLSAQSSAAAKPPSAS